MVSTENNICLMSDSYKFSHCHQYVDGTEVIYSYFESRKGATFDNTVFFGLQSILKKHFVGQVVTEEKINEAEVFINKHLGPGVFNRVGWEYILNKHNGKLPLRIKAIPEGNPISTNNVLMTVENTDPINCYWLTNYVETILTHVWYSSTVATLSREIKKDIKHFLDMTSNDYSKHILFALCDFGYRGTSSLESAGAGGAAHLVNFMGTDTVAGIIHAMDYYNTDVCGYSVAATEHSVMTSMGREGEEQLIGQLLDTYSTGILSLVIDSYDWISFIKICGTKYKDKILNREGRVVFRPDSGDPVSVTLEVLDLLGKYFGYSTNSKGYKVLNDKVRMLWGDGIDKQGIHNILYNAMISKWSTENIIVGQGGGLLQKVNRDTQRFAFKCSAQKRNGIWYDISKDPIDKSKSSKKGRLSLIKEDGEYKTVRETNDERDLLVTVFENGKLVKDYTFDEIRRNAAL